MAIYHCSIKTISRSAGRSSTSAAAYRAGVCISDSRTGEIHDYRRKKGIVYSELVFPEGIKLDREELWNQAEAAEKRKNSTVAREYELALPSELTAMQQRDLALNFARELVERYDVAADVCIHEPSRHGDSRNFHAHILTTTRRLTPDGFAEKTRVLDDRKTGEVEKIRAVWALLANRALERSGHSERIDPRSLSAQGIARMPSIHLGPTATAMERRGIQTERGELNRASTAPSQERAELAELEQIEAGISAAREQARAGWRRMQAEAAAATRRRQREKEERERQRQEAEKRQKEAERERMEARSLFTRYVREQGRDTTAEQQAIQVQRMLAAWEQRTAQEKTDMLMETRQLIEQQEQGRHDRQHDRDDGPSLSM